MSDVETRLKSALAWLERNGTDENRKGLARYAIPAHNAFGVSMTQVQELARQIGHSHELAAALWDSGFHEARMLACFVDDPKWVTAEQMDSWCKDFENWATCDTACFALFDRTERAWEKVEEWALRKKEFEKRAAFALLASLSVHDKDAPDGPYLRGLKLVQAAAADDRHFVKKGVNWALRSIGKRNMALNSAAVGVARRLSAAKDAAPRWVGNDALRELMDPKLLERLAAKEVAKKKAAAKPNPLAIMKTKKPKAKAGAKVGAKVGTKVKRKASEAA